MVEDREHLSELREVKAFFLSAKALRTGALTTSYCNECHWSQKRNYERKDYNDYWPYPYPFSRAYLSLQSTYRSLPQYSCSRPSRIRSSSILVYNRPYGRCLLVVGPLLSVELYLSIPSRIIFARALSVDTLSLSILVEHICLLLSTYRSLAQILLFL